ncbi:uncharacterized protein LOC108667573 [Hyalella azteca]|uniref:Uncharacterized protein LOC108667573 n=1 Tax=Hyalella azteca TaxID=294128 RepID=A0A8B7N8Y5_HYAAZ|nr:uncharacterized protein LOC108667573 [Hyalella azteca]
MDHQKDLLLAILGNSVKCSSGSRQQENATEKNLPQAEETLLNPGAPLAVSKCKFSLIKNGIHANATNMGKEQKPLLLADVVPLLAHVVLGQDIDIDDKQWFKLKLRGSVTSTLLLIADGIGSHHLCHLDCYPDASEDSLPPCKKQKRSSRCKCVANCGVKCVQPLEDRITSALPKLHALMSSAVVTLHPAIYGRSLLQDLFTLRCPESYVTQLRHGSSSQVPVSITQAFPSSTLYNNLSGVQPSTKPETQPIDEKSYDLLEEAYLADENVKLNYYKSLDDKFGSKRLPADRCWDRGTKADLLPPDKFDRRLLLLHLERMISRQYPVPQSLFNEYYHLCMPPPPHRDFSNFIATKPMYAPVTATSPIFSIDCEYRHKKPTLIAVVNESAELVYRTPILSRGEGSDDCGQSLEQVQSVLRERLPPDAIITGHSLHNDLEVLKLYHPYVIDTCFLFDLGPDSLLTHSLRHLTRLFLKKEVQMCKHSYHDPTEDAIASLELLQLKLQKGFTYGEKIKGGYVPPAAALETSQDKMFFQNFFEMYQNCELPKARLVTTECLRSAWDNQMQQFESSLDCDVVTSETQAFRHLPVASNECSSPLTIMHFQCTSILQPKSTRRKAWKKFDSRLTAALEQQPANTLFLVLLPGDTASLSPSPESPCRGLLLLGITK